MSWPVMTGTYLKTAWRNLLKNRIYSVINILGLSLGIALWVAGLRI